MEKEKTIHEHIIEFLTGKDWTVKGDISKYVQAEKGCYEETVSRECRRLSEQGLYQELDSKITGNLAYYRLKGLNTVNDKIEKAKRFYRAYKSLYDKHKEHTKEQDWAMAEYEKILKIDKTVETPVISRFVMSTYGSVKEVPENYKLLKGERFI